MNEPRYSITGTASMAERELYYHDGQRMHLGDRIRIRRFLRPALIATIDYLSGESAANPEFEVDGLVAFVIRRPSNRYVAWMRLPESGSPKSLDWSQEVLPRDRLHSKTTCYELREECVAPARWLDGEYHLAGHVLLSSSRSVSV